MKPSSFRPLNIARALFAVVCIAPFHMVNAEENIIVDKNQSIKIHACANSKSPQGGEILIFDRTMSGSRIISIGQFTLRNECKDIAIPARDHVTVLKIRGHFLQVGNSSIGSASKLSSTSKLLVNLPGKRFVIGFDSSDFVSLLDRKYKDLSIDIEVINPSITAGSNEEVIPDCPEQFSSPACEEERVKRDFTTEPVERVISGKKFWIPKNYITAGNFPGRSRQDGNEVGITIFMPDFIGYTRDNWRNNDSKDRIGVVIKSALDRKAVDVIDEAIKASISSNAPISQALGFDAYLYDFSKTRTNEPPTTYIAKKLGGGDPAYLNCIQPKHWDGRCELYFIDAENNLLVRARFAVDHAPKWQEIESRLRKFISEAVNK